MRVAATAWKGAMTGSRGAGWPARVAAASMSTAAAAMAHSSQTTQASPLMMASSLSGLTRNACSCGQAGRWRGSGQPVKRASAYGGPASTISHRAEPGGGAAQAAEMAGRAGHGSSPLMPSSGAAVAVAWTVIADSPAASRICIGWTMVTVTVTALAVALAVPVAPMPAR